MHVKISHCITMRRKRLSAIMPRVKLSTVGSRAFPVVGPGIAIDRERAGGIGYISPAVGSKHLSAWS